MFVPPDALTPLSKKAERRRMVEEIQVLESVRIASFLQRLVELETEPRCRRRSLRFPHGGGGRARVVGCWGGVGILDDLPARAPIIAGRLWLRLKPSNRLPPPVDTKVAESWRCTEPSDSPPWSTLVKPIWRNLSTRPTLPWSGLTRPGLGDWTRPGVSWLGLGRSGCGARPRFNP